MEKFSLKQLMLALCCVPCLTSVGQISAGRMSDPSVVLIKSGKMPADRPARGCGKKTGSIFEKARQASLLRENAELRQDAKAHEAWFVENVTTENRRIEAIQEAHATREVARQAIDRANLLIRQHNRLAQGYNFLSQNRNDLVTRISTMLPPIIARHNRAIAENTVLRQQNAALKRSLFIAQHTA